MLLRIISAAFIAGLIFPQMAEAQDGWPDGCSLVRVAQVPMTLKTGHVVIPAVANGKDLTLGIDTGARVAIGHRGVFGGADPIALLIGRMTVALRRAQVDKHAKAQRMPLVPAIQTRISGWPVTSRSAPSGAVS